MPGKKENRRKSRDFQGFLTQPSENSTGKACARLIQRLPRCTAKVIVKGEKFIVKIYRANDYEDMSRKAANILSAQVILEPTSVLGLATGSTPLGTYRQLIERCGNGDVDFTNVKSVNLDEYVGLAPDDEQSYRRFMDDNLFRHINIRVENTYVPDGTASDPVAECARYENVINSLGGIDMQLLGIGHNGHIGFNEPCNSFEKNVRLVTLAESTRQANSRFFIGREVPGAAYTIGIDTIMRARRVLVIVSGLDKAEIVRTAFSGPVTPKVPASILQLHGNLTLIGDADALSLLAVE